MKHIENENAGIAEKSYSNFSAIEEKMRRFFRYAVMVSVLGHSPAIIQPTIQNDREMGMQSSRPGVILGPGFPLVPKEGLMEYSDVDTQRYKSQEKEYLNFQRAVEMREEKRKLNRDSRKVDQFMRELKQKLESDNYVPFADFIFSAEEIVVGVDGEIVENAKRIFYEEMEQLKKDKPSIPDEKYLKRVVSFTELGDNEPYEPSQTQVSVYLDRKGENWRGNCQARAKYIAMALEYLYPEYKGGIKFRRSQETDTEGHFTTVFTVNDKTYLVEKNNTGILTDEDRGGTAIFSLRRYIEEFADVSDKPVKIEKPSKKKPDQKRVRYKDDQGERVYFEAPPDDNMFFPNPEFEGKFENKNKKKTNYYSGRYTPPEIRELEAEERQQKSEVGKLKRNNDQNFGITSVNGVNLNDISYFEVSAFQIVRDGKGKMTEVLPWMPIEYSYEQMAAMPQDTMELNTANKMRTPTVDTIRRINGMKRDSVIYYEVEHYSQEVLEEIMNTKSKRVVFALDTPELPTSLRSAMARKGNFYSFPETTTFVISNKGENDNQDLSKGDFELLMQGKGNLQIYYAYPKEFSYEELKMIYQSGRPIIHLTGLLCDNNADAIIKAHEYYEKPQPFLILDTYFYLELAHKNHHLLTINDVGTMVEYLMVAKKYPNTYKTVMTKMPGEFYENYKETMGANNKNVYELWFNAFLLREIIYAQYGEGVKRTRIDDIINILKQINFEATDFEWQAIESDVKKEFSENGINSLPKTRQKFCTNK
ncbi:hypothetical protein JXD20_00710 [Candidatus Peregrinibacteria bacterium]|nr:hypothetical protein [Candidatus Peregrinibacteria bacterium]